MIGTVVTPPALGYLDVQIPGQPVPSRVVSTRAVDAAQAGDSVILWAEGSQLYAIALLGVSTVKPAPPPATTGEVIPATVETRTTVTGSSVLAPSWTGTWRAGAWRPDTTDLYQGDWTGRGLNTGGAFIDGWDAVGTITEARVHMARLSNSGESAAQAPTMLLLGSARGAAPTTLASSAGPALAWGQVSEWVVPAGWLSQMQSGAATGIGISSGSASPYVALGGSSIWMTVDWERTN